MNNIKACILVHFHTEEGIFPNLDQILHFCTTILIFLLAYSYYSQSSLFKWKVFFFTYTKNTYVHKSVLEPASNCAGP